jgi:diketogulonate reductase-like aldo/keto reductase
MNKSIGELIDELSIVNMKIFFLIDKVQNDKHSREEAKKIQDLNKYRSELKNAINEYLQGRQEIKV